MVCMHACMHASLSAYVPTYPPTHQPEYTIRCPKELWRIVYGANGEGRDFPQASKCWLI